MTTHRRRFRRALAGTALISGLLLTGCVPGRPAAPAPGHGPPVLAFVRPGAVMLADDAGRTWGATSLKDQPDRLVWSPDGTRLAWLDVPEAYGVDGSLQILDVAGGRVTSNPCPCRGVGFLGDHAATLSSDGTALLVFPPAGAPRRLALDRPAPVGSRVVASGRDRVAVAVPLPEQEVGVRGQSTLVSVDAGGRVRPLLPRGKMTSLVDALGAPDGSQLAWVDQLTGGACWNTASLPTLGYRGGKAARAAAPTDPAFRKALLTNQRLITSYAWAGSGLTVTFGPGQGCQPVYPFRLVSYYREGPRWTLLGTGWLGVGFGREGRVARLQAPDPATVRREGPDQARVGRLVLTDSAGTERLLGDGVAWFAFTPTEAAGARTPAGPPPQAGAPQEPVLATTDEQGTALSGPLYDLARTIMAAAAGGDVEALIGLCGACDAETVAWLRSADGPRQVLRSLQTHPAVDRDAMVFPGLAKAPCVDDAGKQHTCTAAQIQDAALLDLKSDVSLDLGDRVYRAPRDISIYLRSDATAGGARWVGHLPDPEATSQEDCPTPGGFVTAMERIPGYFTGPVQPGAEVICEGSMAASKVTLDGRPAYIVLVESEGGWNGTNFNGRGSHPRDECAALPPKIYAYLEDSCS